MNDFVAGRLAHERQTDYLRQVARDELAAEVHRVDVATDPDPVGADMVGQPVRRRWIGPLGRLVPTRLVGRGGRP
jgi:hypothetical protein